ncbi:MAG: hypothetical protein FWE31_01935 [Firmicutes bacterium]|nr:hypothetical protein [Bacillota bacterium]
MPIRRKVPPSSEGDNRGESQIDRFYGDAAKNNPAKYDIKKSGSKSKTNGLYESTDKDKEEGQEERSEKPKKKSENMQRLEFIQNSLNPQRSEFDDHRLKRSLDWLRANQVPLRYECPSLTARDGFPSQIFVMAQIEGRWHDLVGWNFGEEIRSRGTIQAADVANLRVEHGRVYRRPVSTNQSTRVAQALNSSSLKQAKFVATQLNFDRKQWKDRYEFAPKEQNLVLKTLFLMRKMQGMELRNEKEAS